MIKQILTLLLLIRAKYQIPRKYCTPVMLTHFGCALLSFCACKFPEKSKTLEPGEIIMECTSYLTGSNTLGVIYEAVTYFIAFSTEVKLRFISCKYLPFLI